MGKLHDDEIVESEPLDPDMKRRGDQFGRLAMIIGYNELAKQVATLGEKIFCRLIVGRLHKEYVDNGGELDMTEREKVIVRLSERAPNILLYPRDIELMRKAIGEHDVAVKQAACRHSASIDTSPAFCADCGKQL